MLEVSKVNSDTAIGLRHAGPDRDPGRTTEDTSKREETSGRAFLDAIAHPVRAKIVVILASEAATAAAIAAEIAEPVRTVRYHLGFLRERGFVSVQRARARRNVHEYSLLATGPGYAEDDLYEQLTAAERRAVTNHYLSIIVRDIAGFVATEAGYADAHFPLTARVIFRADETAWAQLTEVCDRALEEFIDLQRAASERLLQSEGPRLEATVAVLAFERPSEDGNRSGGETREESKRDQTSGEAFVRAIAHPIRSKILVILEHDPATAAELAAEIEEPVRTVRYHLHFLRDRGFIGVQRIRPRRNTYEYSFRGAAFGYVEDELYGRMTPVERRAVTEYYLRVLTRGVGRFVAAGNTYDSHHPYTVRVPLMLDDQGWQALTSTCISLVEQIVALDRDAKSRLAAGEDGSEVEVGVVALDMTLDEAGS